jgi:hypothetical protein
MCAGNSFQIVAAAIGKERLPMDCKRHRGAISRSDAVDYVQLGHDWQTNSRHV